MATDYSRISHKLKIMDYNAYIFLDVLLCSIAKNFFKIYYPIRQIVMSMRANFADNDLRGMRDRRMRNGTELAQKFSSVTDWSKAGRQGKVVFVVSTKLSLAQFVSLFTA